MPKSTLFSDFDKVSAEDWRQKIASDLKDADYDKALIWESPEGIRVKPFYHAENEGVPAGCSSHPIGNWTAGLSICVEHAAKANAKAKDFLSRGAESVHFVIPSEDIQVGDLLEGIDLKSNPVYFELHFLSETYVKSVIDATGDALSNVHLNIDPIGNLARTGNWFFDSKKDHGLLDAIADTDIPNVLCVDLALYQNAGADRVQQLGYALAHANEYLNHFQEGGMPDPVCFKVAVGNNYFFEIAKLRALRLLWATLAAEYGISEDCHIMAVPTKRNKTLYDYNVNMLRTTTECMAAVLGGADTVFNLPYDAIYHKSNEFGDRIALNQLLLLKNESHFDKVGNAADGTYFIELLTRQLAEKALELFKDIEREGGFLAQLKTGTIQKNIKKSAQEEQESFERRETVLVGTNKFKNPEDRMKGTMERHPFAKNYPETTLVEPIIEKRLAEALEQKRLDDE